MGLFNIPEGVWQGGAVGLLGVAFLMVMFGRLVPYRFYKQLERERDFWREAAQKQQGHTEALLPSAHMNVEFVRGLQAALGGPTAIEGGTADSGGEGTE